MSAIRAGCALALGLAVLANCFLPNGPTPPGLQPTWSRSFDRTEGSGWFGRPVINDTKVVFQGLGGRLYAHETSTGESVWVSPSPAVGRSTAAQGALIIVPNAQAIALADRGILSTFATASGAAGWYAVIDTSGLIDFPTIAHQGLVIGVGFSLPAPSDGFAYAVSSEGAIAWRTTIQGEGGKIARPRAVVPFGSSVLVVGSHAGNVPLEQYGFVIALDATNGREQWRYKTADARSVFVGGVVGPDSTLLLTNSGSGGIDAVSLSTKQALWRSPGIASSLGSTEPPAVSGGFVYQGDKGGVVQSVDIRTGARRWTSRVDAGIYDVGVCGNKLVVQHLAITILDLETGAFVGSWGTGETTEFPSSSLAILGRRVFVSGPKGFYAFDC